MSYRVLRLKNEKDLKIRLLNSILLTNPSYSVREYREEPDPHDDTCCLIRFTSYEKSPYCPLQEILDRFVQSNEIECPGGSAAHPETGEDLLLPGGQPRRKDSIK